MALITLNALVIDVLKEGLTRIATEALRRVMARRTEIARVILLEEMKQGRATAPLDALEEDEVVAVLWRYFRAAEEGAARLNLRLMASVLAGQAASGSVHADEFLRWADLLASLSYEEVALVSTLHRHRRAEGSWMRAKSKEERTQITAAQKEADRLAREETVGKIFSSEEQYDLTAQALQRTGLVVQLDLGMWGVGAPPVFATTERTTALARLSNLDEVLNR